MTLYAPQTFWDLPEAVQLPPRRELTNAEVHECYCRLLYGMIQEAAMTVRDPYESRQERLLAAYFLTQGDAEWWLNAAGITITDKLKARLQELGRTR